MEELNPVTHEVYIEVQQRLFQETRMLREERWREWLETMVEKDIVYRAIVSQLRFRKDNRYTGDKDVPSLDENWAGLDRRVAQMESGMQWTADPAERIRHFITNLEVFEGKNPNEYVVYSNCQTVRNRRVYEEMTYCYGRNDVWRRGADGKLRLTRREVDVEERIVSGKNHNCPM